MHFQGRKLKKGDLLQITSTGQVIRVEGSNLLGNGRVEVAYTYSQDLNKSNKKQVYLDVLELMGLERLDA